MGKKRDLIQKINYEAIWHNSPELILYGELNKKSDVWMVGMNLLCGFIWYEDEDVNDKFFDHAKWYYGEGIDDSVKYNYGVPFPYTVPDGTDQQLKNFLDNSMQVNPRNRWSISKLLKHPFITNNND
ncbi:hypothetical protein ECANGB1_1588 [Enterospora canceri]|uniref:Protein kinase domain-containing protein n=1 Tax=Enterospora canceri TaxID=1081671 RepID=A0A1Y1S3W4_9MICR|nr:hypothetical protein ECANGB1_1588 [Enterospora canceri]